MIIDGKAIAQIIQNEIKASIAEIKGRPPALAVIIVGNHPPSIIYVDRKTKACAEVGMRSKKIQFSDQISEAELIDTIKALNDDSEIDGILLQLPLPPHLNQMKILHQISPDKDVDGLHPYNVGKMLIGDTHTFFPCTPLGVKELLMRSGVNTKGKHVVILGRSNLVGKPMAAILMQNAAGANATVTIAHSQSKNLKELCVSADILIAAIGHPHFVKADMVKDKAVVIDVGINKIEANNSLGYRLVGDVDFEQVRDKCDLITPVPGGVGPMTIVMLLSNTLKSYNFKYRLDR